MPTPTWICLDISVPEPSAEILLARLSLLGMGGCEERGHGASVAYRAYFDAGVALATLSETIALAPGARVLASSTVENEDWNATWRASIQPVRLCERVWVSPAWREPLLAPGEQWIRIEPKMAFGTGHHETTRLAAEGVVMCSRGAGPAPTLLDIGTGSGVLCFCAALHGFAECIGVELDPDCRGNLAENALANRSGARVAFVTGTTEALSATARFDVVAMNMIYNESAPQLPFVAAALRPGGRLVWSGILVDGREEAVAAAQHARLILREERTEGEWWMGVMVAGG